MKIVIVSKFILPNSMVFLIINMWTCQITTRIKGYLMGHKFDFQNILEISLFLRDLLILIYLVDSESFYGVFKALCRSIYKNSVHIGVIEVK